MRHGFIKVAAATPRIRVADCEYNVTSIKSAIDSAVQKKVKLLVFPELCITGYTCGDLFYQDTFLDAAQKALVDIKNYAASCDMLIFVGLPLREGGRIYNVTAAVKGGKILGIVPKTYLANYNEFYEKRQFAEAMKGNITVRIDGEDCLFGTDILFCCKQLSELVIAAEICEDLWVMSPPSSRHAAAGATVIINASASNELVGKAEYRRSLVSGQSARLISGYIYADIGAGESTTDLVFGGHNIIAENGKVLSEAKLFENEITVSELDVKFLAAERAKIANYNRYDEGYGKVYFDTEQCDTELSRTYPQLAFVPQEEATLAERTELILTMQAAALKKRIEHCGSKAAVIGISGGLDSTLAILVAVRTMKLLNRRCGDVIGIALPCYGTSARTYGNAEALAKALGITFKVIDIKDAVSAHLLAIGHGGEQDLTYENSQARERTQVLMDYASSAGGLVVGTGDLSELALGWATYNGDHMSMYGVNSSVPKTLVKSLVKYEAERYGGKIQTVLSDILDTPISPELLPPKNGVIQQNTEEIVGPYELHDFYLYYMIRMGFAPSKVYRLSKYSFSDKYDAATIKKWLTVFIKRFFAQQFKRSCMPDGVKIGSVSLSPRGDWRMPSDASFSVWLAELDK